MTAAAPGTTGTIVNGTYVPPSGSPWFGYRVLAQSFPSTYAYLVYRGSWSSSCIPPPVSNASGVITQRTTTAGESAVLWFGGIGAILRASSVGPANSTVQTWIDGVQGLEFQVPPVPPGGSELFPIQVQDLVNTNHSLQITLASGPGVIIQSGAVMIPAAPPGSDFFSMVPHPTQEDGPVPVTKRAATGPVQVGGGSFVTSAPDDWVLIPCGVDDQDCPPIGRYVETNKSGAWIAYQAPAQTVGMSFSGWSVPNGGSMKVFVQPPPPLDVTGLSYARANGEDGSRSVVVAKQYAPCQAMQTVYMAQLDRGRRYSLNATCTAEAGQKCSFAFATFHIANPSSKTNKGAIAGGVRPAPEVVEEDKLAEDEAGAQGSDESASSEAHAAAHATPPPEQPADAPTEVSTQPQGAAYAYLAHGAASTPPLHTPVQPPPPSLPTNPNPTPVFHMRPQHLPAIDTGAVALARSADRAQPPTTATTMSSRSGSGSVPPLIAELKSGSPLISNGTPVTARSGHRSLASMFGGRAPEPTPPLPELVGVHRSQDAGDLEGVRMAEDAGRIRAEELPPRYNPQWRDEGEGEAVVRQAEAGTTSGTTPPARTTPPGLTPPDMTPLETVMERPSVEVERHGVAGAAGAPDRHDARPATPEAEREPAAAAAAVEAPAT
ncbi:uncharacterized protein LOC62_05G007617 [Vanrija pseudolonga]|uniref:Uncharacterized protein n=1 Tax=Vanrija pseudolonga TaxID=143232 RepID=A0AAF0YCA6_9TREE|nr:hypothetical protein LOC62_05G007617 [Vanrija pseudolonga]